MPVRRAVVLSDVLVACAASAARVACVDRAACAVCVAWWSALQIGPRRRFQGRAGVPAKFAGSRSSPITGRLQWVNSETVSAALRHCAGSQP